MGYDYDVGKSHNDREQYKRIKIIIEKLARLLPSRFVLNCYALIASVEGL